MKKIILTALLWTTWLAMAVVFFVGCSHTRVIVTSPDGTKASVSNLRTLLDSDYEDLYLYHPDGFHIEAGKIESSPDPNSINALGGAVGNAGKTLIKP
jgi:hypothetical protein